MTYSPDVFMNAIIESYADTMPKDFLEEMRASTDMIRIADEWLKSDPGTAILMMEGLMEKIELLRKGPDLVDIVRDWDATSFDQEHRHEEIIRHLHSAKTLAADENADPKLATSIEAAIIRAESNGFPSFPCPIHDKHIGKSGGAAANEGALNGITVRLIISLLPSNLERDYSLIARIAGLCGRSISRQNARSIFMKGRT